jgi:cell division protein FtsB
MLSANPAKLSSWLKRRGFTAILVALLVLMHYPLWLGEGGWLAVRQGIHKLDTQRNLNQRLRERNEILQAEVSDLKQGREAIEERARIELGMIAPDETFIRILAGPVAENNRRPLDRKPHDPSHWKKP